MVYLLIRLERALSRPQCLARKPLSIKTDLPSRSYSVFLFFAKKDHSDVSVSYVPIYHQNDAGCKRSKFVVFKIPQGDFSKPRNLNVTSDLPKISGGTQF